MLDWLSLIFCGDWWDLCVLGTLWAQSYLWNTTENYFGGCNKIEMFGLYGFGQKNTIIFGHDGLCSYGEANIIVIFTTDFLLLQLSNHYFTFCFVKWTLSFDLVNIDLLQISQTLEDNITSKNCSLNNLLFCFSQCPLVRWATGALWNQFMRHCTSSFLNKSLPLNLETSTYAWPLYQSFLCLGHLLHTQHTHDYHMYFNWTSC